MGRPAPSTSGASRGVGDAARPLVLGPDVVVAGKYRLRETLRRGGMGSVWVATHLSLDTPVALKFMLDLAGQQPSGGPGAPTPGQEAGSSSISSRERFDREAKAAAQIRSANVVQILDYGVDRGTPYIAMELLHGEDLGARLKRMGRLPFEEVTAIVVAVTRALQRAHDVGLVHRDLKPANVFLARDGDEVVPKVLDFGVAKVVHKTPVDGATIEGTLVGTPSYMSPEQAMGKSALDQRADLWSLGVIVYRALTGGRPFESESFGELVVQICGQDPVPPTQRAPGVPPGVDAFIARALERDPAKRFQSAREMGRAFLAIVPGASPVATAWTDDRATPVNSDDPPSRIQVSESSSKRLNAAPPSSHGVDATGPAPSISMTSAPPSGSMGSAPSGSFGSAPRLGAAPGAMNGMAAYGAPPWAPSYTPAPDARPRRPSPIAAVLGCFAGFGLVGALLVGFSYHRAAKRSAEPEIVSAAASLSAAPSVATVPIVSVPEAAKEAPTIAPIAAPPPTGLAEKAPPSAATPPPGARPRSIPRAASTAKHVDCSSPYYYNSEGTKFIKPECL